MEKLCNCTKELDKQFSAAEAASAFFTAQTQSGEPPALDLI